MNNPTITIRRGRPEDAAAIARVAGLDSRHTPAAPVLLAEVDGDVRAAVSLIDGAVVADPFTQTSTVRSLLLTRAAQLRGDRGRRLVLARPLRGRPHGV